MQEGRRWIGLARETCRGKRTLDVKGIDGEFPGYMKRNLE